MGVSYASPAYYADRLCERGRCYLRQWYNPDNTMRSNYDKKRSAVERNVERQRNRPDHRRGQKKTVQEIAEDKADADEVLTQMKVWFKPDIDARWDRSLDPIVDNDEGRRRKQIWLRTMYWM